MILCLSIWLHTMNAFIGRLMCSLSFLGDGELVLEPSDMLVPGGDICDMADMADRLDDMPDICCMVDMLMADGML